MDESQYKKIPEEQFARIHDKIKDAFQDEGLKPNEIAGILVWMVKDLIQTVSGDEWTSYNRIAEYFRSLARETIEED